jgi:outer membrane protein OmpA-like peptidoglycan-associated protein
MVSYVQGLRGRVAVGRLVAVALVCSFGAIAAQDRPAPKWEIYGGYSFFYPGTDVHGLLPGGLLPVSSRLESNPRGAGATLTYNFNRWFGLTGDISGHWGSGEKGTPERIDDAAFYNLSVGPKITFRSHYFSPFLEALVGGHRLTPDLFHRDDQFGFMAGGGLDLNLSRHFALRLLRADYVFSNHQFGPDSVVRGTDVRGVRLQSGVVFLLGGGKAGPPVSASCTVSPAEVMPGEPVTASAAGNNFNSNHALTYKWTTTGGQVTGRDNTASIDTTNMAAGGYTVTAHVSDSRMKKGGEATCAATFGIKELPKNPPTISCSADPSTVQTGVSATIQCSCTSPDNSPITVGGWTANGGTVSGNGNTASLSTSGATAGPITVTASCNDSRGLNTQGTAQVMVEAPPPVNPEILRLESRLALHSVYFPTAKPSSQKPDGGLLPSQEKTLASLAEDFKKYLESKPDAHLTLEGHADPRGSVEYNRALSERRVESTRRFLTDHGVPAANVETKAFGEQENLTEAQVKDAVQQNPELTSEQRQRVLSNIEKVLLASNRRVDITLSTTGQQSVRQFPFNAADSLTLLSEEGTSKSSGAAGRKKARPKGQN